MISNDDKITGRPTVPIVSPVSGGGNGNGHPTSELDDESNGSIWEQDKNREEENESQGGADPSLPWETNLRLPRSVIPNHYDLYLFPDLSTGMFSGKIYIVIAIYCFATKYCRYRRSSSYALVHIFFRKCFYTRDE